MLVKQLSCSTSKTSYMTIGSRQNLANAKFMNLELDNRPIEHKPSTKLLGVHSGVLAREAHLRSTMGNKMW